MTPLLSAGARGRVVAALRTYFNFMALNLALVIASVPLVTLPAALQAATFALERWRAEGEDRVVREFAAALRSRPLLPTTLRTGVPVLAVALAVEEVHFFARGGSPADWFCLGSGVAGLVIAAGALGYVLLLGAREPLLGTAELWCASAKLALQNVFVTGPLFLLELASAALLGFLDPALVLIGLPLAFLQLARLTARLGLRRLPVVAGKSS
jgi:hypothetical protein